MSTIKTTKTTTSKVGDVRMACQQIGDKLKDQYELTSDVKLAAGAVNAYSKAINAAKSQLVYKKLTGSPSDIDFFN
jgi:hypothetical protein